MLRKNVAGQFVYFGGINATTGAALTGATFSGRRCLDGVFAAIGGTISEDTGVGFYKVALTQADTNGNNIGYFFTATNAVPVPMTIITTAADPTDAVRFGLTALPNAAANAAGGLPISAAGALDLDAQRSDVAAILVDTAEIGAAGAGLTALASAANLATVAGYLDTEIAAILADTNELQTDWADGGRLDLILDARASQASVDTVDGVVDAILLDTAEIGVAGAGLTNISLPNQTMNITGNLSGSVGSVTDPVAITSNIKRNQALAAFQFLMTDSTSHAPAAGLSVTVTRSIDGGVFGAGTLSAVTEIANGLYSVDFGAADLNGKVITLQATAATADTTFERIITQA